MLGNDPLQTTAENYLGFSRYEAAGKSPLYAELTAGVADDSAILAFLTQQPPAKRQPNLLLAAVRYLYGTQPNYESFRAATKQELEIRTGAADNWWVLPLKWNEHINNN